MNTPALHRATTKETSTCRYERRADCQIHAVTGVWPDTVSGSLAGKDRQ